MHQIAEEAEPALRGSQQSAWFERLEREHENLRAALKWLFAQKEAEMAIRRANALGLFWFSESHWNEERTYLEQALARSQGEVTRVRMATLHLLGHLLLNQGELARAEELLRETLARAREHGQTDYLSYALLALAMTAAEQGSYAAVHTLFEEGVPFLREADSPGLPGALCNWAFLALRRRREPGASQRNGNNERELLVAQLVREDSLGLWERRSRTHLS